MYFYLYDDFLTEKKYKSALDKIENRLTDLEMRHKTGRLSILKNIKEMIEDEISKGVETIVAVGDDQTVFKIINVLAFHPEITLGIIPIGPNNNIAKILGIPPEEESCDVLSSRIIKKLDLGKINHHYFISEVAFPGGKTIISCKEGYKIHPSESSEVKIYNFNFKDNSILTNPQDGVLELCVKEKSNSILPKIIKGKDKKDQSLFSIKDVEVISKNEPIKIVIDHQHTIKTPAHISVLAKKLKVIVGKNRLFE